MNARPLVSQLAKHLVQLAIRVANRLNNMMFLKQREIAAYYVMAARKMRLHKI